MLTEETLVEALTSRGCKLTRPRRAVLRVVAAGASLNPAEIHVRARRIHPRTGLVTVYRTLELLADLGAVRRIHEADGCHAYALASEGHAHHIICEQCHAVVEFADCDLADLLSAAQRRSGYRIQDHWLELFGTCPSCQRKDA